MTKLYVTEYERLGMPDNGPGQQMPLEPPLAEQVVDYSGGHAESAAFQKNTAFVVIHTDAICSVSFGTAPVATTGMARMAAGETRFRGVPPGRSFKVSAITNT